jgi:hypothetical protein
MVSDQKCDQIMTENVTKDVVSDQNCDKKLTKDVLSEEKMW